MQTVAEPLREFLAATGASEFDAALMVARLLDPGLDAARVRAERDRLLERCRAALAGRVAGAEAVCDGLRAQGFAGADADYYSLDNSRIERVLARRRGIPITLGVLCIEVARALGLRAGGINFPRHFLVRCGADLIDPFALEVVTEAECRQRLGEAGARPDAEVFAAASAHAIALRMLNNVKAVLLGRGMLEAAVAMVAHQRLLAPDNVGLLLEEAVLYERLGAPALALAALMEAHARMPAGEARTRIAARIDALRASGSPTLH
ncbi:MAG: transglutaminase family protein [Gammaproteobacteria bacterium]|nr:transglutaminase family protein [Gammaproteobacteria bacterium]